MLCMETRILLFTHSLVPCNVRRGHFRPGLLIGSQKVLLPFCCLCFEAESQEAQAGLVGKVDLLFLIFLPLHLCVGKYEPPYSAYSGAGNGAQGCLQVRHRLTNCTASADLYHLLFKNPQNLEAEVMVSKQKCIVWQPSYLTYLGTFQ